MAAAYIRVYVNRYSEETHVRTCGGNRRAIKETGRNYLQMTKEQFLKKHPYFADECKYEFKILVDYVVKHC